MVTEHPAPDDQAGQQDLLPGLRASLSSAKKRTAASARATPATTPAEVDPVARVLPDLPLPHLDRPFDYLVPAAMADTAVPGCRVKVRFAGQDIDAYLLERRRDSQHDGRLMPLRRVVSPEPVLHPEIARLVEALAHRYVGTRADLLRLAIAPRHAATEKKAPGPAAEPVTGPETVLQSAVSAWAEHPLAGAFLGHLARGGGPRAVWGAPPTVDWAHLLAHAAAVTLAGGRGVVMCVPDARDLARLDEAMTAVLGQGRHVVLSADLGPAARYAAYLRVSRGLVSAVIGTRSAAFAPVHDLGLVAMWDDGDDLYAEPRAPYPHTREVLITRADQTGAAALVAGFARTCEAQRLVDTGWAHELSVTREHVRTLVRPVVSEGADRAVSTRLPRAAREAIRAGLERGPVLVQTPRTGYAASLACERCRTPARCVECRGPLAQPSPASPPTCRWCGVHAAPWQCGECGHVGLRAPVLGDQRTAEELGRAFPGVPVRLSSGERVVAEVDDRPALVVATPGAEPVARDGYAAVVLLDTWLTLARVDLRSDEEALRRWLNAAALVRPGGHVVAVGDPAAPTLQALVRWDPAGFAARELTDRASAHLPPMARLASVSGAAEAVTALVETIDLPASAEVLGPVTTDDETRVVLRVPLSHADALATALHDTLAQRSARKLPSLRVQVDPPSL